MRRIHVAIIASTAACAVGEPEVDTPTTPKPPAPALVELDFCNEIPEEPPWEYEDWVPDPAYAFPHCNNHGISTIEEVAAQTGLRRLELHDDWNGGFAILAPLVELESLHALSTSETDLDSLRRLPNLTDLSVDLTDQLDLDVRPLADLSRLRSLELRLSLSHQSVVDLTPIAKLAELRTLRIDLPLDGKLLHVDSLRSLTALQELELGAPLSERQLRALPSVAKLSVQVDGKLSLRALAHQTNVEELSVTAERITDFAIVRRFTKLRRIVIEVRRGTFAISQLRDAAALEYLYVPIFAVRYRDLAALRAKRPALEIELEYSPCEILDNRLLEPGETISRAELDELQRDNGRCD